MGEIIPFSRKRKDLEEVVNSNDEKVSPGMAVYYVVLALTTYLKSYLNNKRIVRIMEDVGLYMANLDMRELPKIMNLGPENQVYASCSIQ